MSTTAPPLVSLASIMRRPRWIATLVLALAIAGGFAALGQWQLERAVSSGEVTSGQSETVKPLETVAEPQAPVIETQAAQRVEVAGALVPSGFDVISGRLNDGVSGYWVIGQMKVDRPADTYLAVALGWTPDLETARATAAELTDRGAGVSGDFTGRYLPTEGPVVSDAQRGSSADPMGDSTFEALDTTMSIAVLVNRWPEFDDTAEVYGGYLVLDEAPAGLEAIDSPEPDRSVQVNWLNIFYAAEWVVFAGFAVYLWYRLVRDAWERENEEALEAAEAAGGSGASAERR
ncbi:SURF1 family cytochrome oxidase biogenesis protein [Herbiconiux sp. KACC 21604]|uniref:SURF1 family protein n=1 Tax=unclassified Herbiconiux TaxID=2618217 RepID=UPI0020A34B16|nr:SURF1 family cytochrome oxidase biogenesis protein [Herbiconiux sp. SALV-R1]WPO87325.1 SURF1 family cytochrome oxidase biogenesis protein [Herbiconiux sp. KACC 21604]